MSSFEPDNTTFSECVTFSAARRPIIVGIAGGTGSGKTTFAEAVTGALGPENVACISHDSYYRGVGHLSPEEGAKTNFDHPDSLETSLLVEHVKQLLNNQEIKLPVYDFATHTRRSDVTVTVPAKPVIIVEGILLFACPDLVELLDIKVFVDTDDDIRFIRRLRRDVAERSRTVECVTDQFLSTVRPMHVQFVLPSKAEADVIVPGVKGFQVVVDMLVCRLRNYVK